eukprot:762867-Hanusia_phi.AAC.1
MGSEGGGLVALILASWDESCAAVGNGARDELDVKYEWRCEMALGQGGEGRGGEERRGSEKERRNEG